MEQLQEQLSKVTQENETLRAELDQFQVKEALDTKRAKIAEMVSNSDLPKAAVTDTFMEQLMAANDDAVDAIIKDRQELVKANVVQRQPEKDLSDIVESLGAAKSSSDVDLSAVASRLFI